MVIREVLKQEQEIFDQVVSHPLQTWAWGEFKAQTPGTEVLRLAAFDGSRLTKGYQFTIHTVPYLGWKIGYFPKGQAPDDAQMYAIRTAARQHNLVYVKIEPDISAPVEKATSLLQPHRDYLTQNSCQKGRVMFTPYSFILDLTPTEDDLLAGLKSKTRYNVKLAQKSGVQVTVDNSEAAFAEYIKLWKETTKRQAFYSHDQKYHQNMWAFMNKSGTAHLLKATYQNQTLGIWIVFVHAGVLYYPYGASSRQHREVMANNLLAWEAIRFGKQQGCRSFDMWGSLGPDADPDNPWFGFHRFKAGYGGELCEFVGTYDYVADPQRHQVFTKLDDLRWKLLRLRSKLPF